MIIGHEHRYLFVELPNTGTSAIHAALCEQYGGEPILHKHAYYQEFLSIARAEEKDYFVFSCIRNPLDIVVSGYFKHKTNHRGWFTDPKMRKENGGWVTARNLRKYRFIQDTSADFAAYFQKFYRFPPWDDWSSLAHKEFDYVIRFENLEADFARVLALLDLDAGEGLPVVNRTAGRDRDFWSYYTPEIRAQAVWVFGPFLREWGYEFPPEWGVTALPWTSRALFRLLRWPRKRLEWGASFDAGLLKQLAGV